VWLGSLDIQDILSASSGAMEALTGGGEDGILMFSCAGRNFVLGLDTMAEIGVVQQGLGPGRSYLLAYSGGEFCPVKAQDGKLINRFHNVTLISCSFK
jgi:hypothetical protein